MTKKSPRELCASTSSSLIPPAVIPGPHYSHRRPRLRSFSHPTEGPFFFNGTASAVFNISWQLRSLSVNLTPPSDLKIKQRENNCFFDHTKTVHQIHALSFEPIFSEHLQGFRINDMTLDLLYRYAFGNTKNVQQKCALPGPKNCMLLQKLI